MNQKKEKQITCQIPIRKRNINHRKSKRDECFFNSSLTCYIDLFIAAYEIGNAPECWCLPCHDYRTAYIITIHYTHSMEMKNMKFSWIKMKLLNYTMPKRCIILNQIYKFNNEKFNKRCANRSFSIVEALISNSTKLNNLKLFLL